MYDPEAFTYGLELEYADVDRRQQLPEGFTWNKHDYSIVNSSGVANDPLGKLWRWGGEINTPPTPSINEQVQRVTELNAMLAPAPVINYRCNLHVHVGIPGLRDDLDALKRVLRYIQNHASAAFALVEPIPKPTPQEYPPLALEGAMKRYQRRKRSHQYMLPPGRVEEMLAATTPEGFYRAHAPIGKNNTRMWYFSPRAGINLRPLWEHGTVEFRHFPGTIDPVELASCLRWCRAFMEAALSADGTPWPATIHRDLGPVVRFPRFQPYRHELELIYRVTNLEHNSRATVRAVLDGLALRGIIATEAAL